MALHPAHNTQIRSAQIWQNSLQMSGWVSSLMIFISSPLLPRPTYPTGEQRKKTKKTNIPMYIIFVMF